MDEHDVVEAGTDLLFGDPKSVLKKIGLSILDKKQFEAIFVSAGKTVAEYEKDNTEQNDIRKILFCEETMRLLANEIRKSNSFDWLNDLDRCVNDLLSLSELDSINKARCKKHFEDIVIYQIKKLFPQRYGSYCLGDIHDNVNSLMASTQSSNETLNKILELNRSTVTICSYSRSGHAEGYQLYKVLEKLGIPFKCGCVTVISDMELSLISSICDINNRLGLLLLVRCSSTGTIEKLVNRKFVMDLESGYIDDVIDILINAIEVNIGEIIAMGNGFPEYLAGHIRENVPILLQRFSSRASERMQKKELQFIQKIMSYIILNKISKYWYKIAENTANIMFEDNSRKAVYAIAAMLENCNSMISDEAREILIKLAHEMNEKGIYTKCFDIFILRDEQWERDVQENIFAMNESQSIDSLRAMEKYIKRYPDSVITSEMLEKIVELIELRKEPGLLSAIWILHNLVYAKNTVIDTIGIERIDRLLFFWAELINYDNAAMKDIKHCIELRQACAALAFRLFDWKTVNCGKGVEKWREICKSSDEANEVRNQWIW